MSLGYFDASAEASYPQHDSGSMSTDQQTLEERKATMAVAEPDNADATPSPMALLRRLAAEVYAELGVSDVATETYLKKIKADRLESFALRHGAHVLLHEAMRGMRGRKGHLTAIPGTSVEEEDAEMEWAIETVLRAEWPLAGGKHLRDSTLRDLQEQAEANETLARGNMLAAKFMRAVIAAREEAGVPADQATGSKLSDAKIQEIYDSVYGAKGE